MKLTLNPHGSAALTTGSSKSQDLRVRQCALPFGLPVPPGSPIWLSASAPFKSLFKRSHGPNLRFALPLWLESFKLVFEDFKVYEPLHYLQLQIPNLLLSGLPGAI